MNRPPPYTGDEPYIFVSYSHLDEERVFSEITWLTEQGIHVWYDEGITPGEEWTAELAQAIRDASHFLFLVTPNSVVSKNCSNEVQFALKQDKQLVVAHMEETQLPDALELAIGSVQAIIGHKFARETFRQKILSALTEKALPTSTAAIPIPPKRRTPVYAALATLAIVAAVLLWMLVDDPGTEPEYAESEGNALDAPVPGFSGRAAIAVLPFVNMSEDPEQEYFADGITEDLITGLQSFQSFPIIARTSTFQYKGQSPDVRNVASALGAGYVIEGSTRKIDDQVRINAQLINRDGRNVWAENYDFKFHDVLRIQTELVDRILHAIEPELIVTEADRSRFVRTEDMEAFDYFLQATTNTFAPFAYTDLNRQTVTPERLEKARALAHKALELDPDFAAAYRLLNHIDASYILNLPYVLTAEEREAALARSIESGEKSRQLSPFEPTVCSCLAAMLLISGDLDGAVRLAEESLRQNPANAGVHAVLAKILQVKGEHDRALEQIRIGMRLSPQDMGMTMFMYFEAAILQASGRFDEARLVAEQAILLSPVNYDAHYVRILSLVASGQSTAARRAVAELEASVPDDFVPVSGWTEPFPNALAEAIQLTNRRPLTGILFNDGLDAVLADLGWRDTAI